MLLGAVLVVALTLASGLIQGRMSDRWGPSAGLATAGAKLQEFPMGFGDKRSGDYWEMQSSEQMSDNVVDMLQCAGYANRTYVNRKTRAAVRMALLVGPPQPTTLHTPEICFSSRDFTQLDERRLVAITDQDGSENEFWAVDFKSNQIAVGLRAYYAWSDGTHWSTLKESRFTVGKYPYLYKIQLASSMPLGASPEDNDPCGEFLRAFLQIPKSTWSKPAASDARSP